MSVEAYFRSSGYLPDPLIETSTGEPFSIAALPAFLRTLLVADGTVTKALEAYFWEPLEVQPISQSYKANPQGCKDLLDSSGSQVLEREVKLMGRLSGCCFACARSYLVLDYLPDSLVEGITAGRLGIGELLREEGVETYREIVRLDSFPRGVRSDEVPGGLDDDLVARSYRIRVGGVPAILVTEYFPLAPYRERV